MVMQNNEDLKKNILTTFGCKQHQQHGSSKKRPAPIAPPLLALAAAAAAAAEASLDVNPNNTSGMNNQEELVIKVPLSKIPMDAQLLSSSSCSSSNINNNSSSTASSSSCANHKLKTSSQMCSTISSVSSPSTGSTASNESVLISSSSPSSPRLFYNNNAFDASNSFDEVIIDLDHREMAIDCPDGFKPEFKTKPLPPNVYSINTTASQHQPSCKNISLIKPLLTIFQNHKNSDNAKSNCCVAVENNDKLKETIVHCINESKQFNSQQQPTQQQLSCSFSSIQFIDDDAKSRMNLNDTTLTNTTVNMTAPLITCEKPAQNTISNGKVSLGKKLFDKQKLDLENINNEEFTNGTVNGGFEMEESEYHIEDNEENDLISRGVKKQVVVRAPTPPNPTNATNFTCFNIIDSSSSVQIPIESRTAAEEYDDLDHIKKISELKLIEEKFIDFKSTQPLMNSAMSPAASLISSSSKSNSFRLLETETTASNYPTNNYLDYSAVTSVSSISNKHHSHMNNIQNNISNHLETTTISTATSTTTSKTYDITEIFKHFDVLQTKLDLLKLNNNNHQAILSTAKTTVETKPNNLCDNDLDNLYKTCNNDINLIRKLIKTENFKNTLNLYNKFIKLASKYDLKPVTNDSSNLVDEIMKYLKQRETHYDADTDSSSSSTELCMLLSKYDLKSLLNTHDELANKFDQMKNEQQRLNRDIMLEHQKLQCNKKQQQTYDVIKKYGSLENLIQYEMAALNNLAEEEETFDATDELMACGAPVERSEVIEEKFENVNGDDTQDHLLSDEGKFLLSKAQHYSVDNLKLVNIEKLDAPLGATIRNRDGSIVISRIVMGGAAQQSGLLHEDDEILEINNIPVRGKTINDICDMLANLQGIVSFLIIPNMNYEPTVQKLQPIIDEKSQENIVIKTTIESAHKVVHIRALFNYVPQEDLYIPCKELGLAFSKGDILHIISQDDCDWWQAYKDEDKDQSLAGLIPSQVFQEKRFSQMQILVGDSFMDRKKREKGFCMRGANKNRRRRMLNGMCDAYSEEILTYEEVRPYKPPINRKRPIVLIGPHSIGRHELRKRLMQSNPSLFEVAVPHTTRLPRRDEIDGKDYHFLPRHIFEADIKQGRFIEYGEYEKNLYGTSSEAIRKVIENSKICVLNLYPQALKTLRNSDLMPYVIYVGPPNLNKLKELKNKLNEPYRENDLLDIIDKGREIEELYGHYFDKIIRNSDMDKTYHELYHTILSVQSEENWVPVSWLNNSSY